MRFIIQISRICLSYLFSEGLPPLVNRQERRACVIAFMNAKYLDLSGRQPSAPSMQTTDSWDFNQSQTTIQMASPTLTARFRSSSIPHMATNTTKTSSSDLLSEPIFDDEEDVHLDPAAPLMMRRSTLPIVASPTDDPASDPENPFSKSRDGYLAPSINEGAPKRPPLSPAPSTISTLSSSTASSMAGSTSPSAASGSPSSGGFWKRLKNKKAH